MLAPQGDDGVDDGAVDVPDGVIVIDEDAAGARVTTGLVALYTFEEGSGTVVMDRSGVGSALNLTIGTPAAATWGTGTLTVTGENQVASAAAATKILDGCRAADAFTLEAWLQPTQIITAYFARIVTVSSSNSDLAASLLAVNDHFELRMRGPMTDSNGLPQLSSAAGTIALAQMHVVIVSEAGAARRIYINGVESVTDVLGGDLASWGAGHRFGLGNELDGGRQWLGTFDLVAVYARALSAVEVAQNFAAGPR
jgi:Concanavalin A-like lectin/glucanases superfamily